MIKSFKPFVLGLVLGVLMMGGWWLVSRKTTLASPAMIFASAPLPITKTISVGAGQTVEFPFASPEGKVPGRLWGHWTSRGSSAGVKGASGDSIVKFTLRGPHSEVVQTLDHPTSGNFSVRLDAAGTYTFVFDNSGLIGPTPRTIEFEGTYQAD